MADLAAIEADYYKAIGYYEKVGKVSIDNNLMKWSVKDYFFKAGICHLASGVCLRIPMKQNILFANHFLAQDLVATNRALEGYRDLDPTFASTREHALLVDLLQAVEQGEPDTFADKLFQFDQLSKLDKWKTTLFLRVKGNIEETGEDFS